MKPREQVIAKARSRNIGVGIEFGMGRQLMDPDGWDTASVDRVKHHKFCRCTQDATIPQASNADHRLETLGAEGFWSCKVKRLETAVRLL